MESNVTRSTRNTGTWKRRGGSSSDVRPFGTRGRITTDNTEFENLRNFVSQHPERHLKTLEVESNIIKNINEIENLIVSASG